MGFEQATPVHPYQGRVAMTMQERGDASVAGLGLYSSNLEREAMTMQEGGNAVAKTRFLAAP